MSKDYEELLGQMMDLVAKITEEAVTDVIEVEDDGVELMKELSFIKYLESLDDDEFYQA